jgi:hypothetical protein
MTYITNGVKPLAPTGGSVSGTTDTAAIYAAVVAVAEAQIGAPYAYGHNGPNTFDCSGLVQYAYQNGAGIAIGRDTTQQFSSPLGTVLANPASLSEIGFATTVSAMQPGDLIFYAAPGASGPRAHVQMYIGNNQVVSAPETGTLVQNQPLPQNFVLDSIEPFQGVVRYDVSGGTPNASVIATASAAQAGLAAASVPNVDPGTSDPRNNLPFSPFFMGQQVNGQGSGGFTFNTSASQVFNQDTGIVRGGMAQLQPNPGQTPFQVYFMMNPQSISVDYNIQASNMGQSSNLNAAQQSQQTSPISNMSCSFTVFFNRMYEVWQGGTDGPSDIGVRWDVRALERLFNMYDDTQGPGGGPSTGISNYGNGANQPTANPVQVVFGTKNALRFQGMVNSLSVEYTIFSKDMVPVECEVDLAISWVYNPETGADLSTALVQTYASTGNYSGGTPTTNGLFPTGITPGTHTSTPSTSGAAS